MLPIICITLVMRLRHAIYRRSLCIDTDMLRLVAAVVATWAEFQHGVAYCATV